MAVTQTVEGTEHFASQEETPPDVLNLVEEFAFQYGLTFDSYLVTECDREYFLGYGRSGVVGFKRAGRFAHIVGGLLAPPEDRAALLAAFLRFAAINRLHCTFYNIGPSDARLFQQMGCEITKCGEEPIVDLTACTWRGKSHEWARRQENYCLRQGVQCVEIQPDLDDPAFVEGLAPQLREVSDEHLSRTIQGKELGFFVSNFDPLRLGRRRLFVAERGQRIDAYVVCNPCLGGRRWAIETYRRRTDAPRGIIPFLMLQTMRRLQAEDVEGVSLSLIPCVNCEQKLDSGDSAIYRFCVVFWWNWLNWLFDMRGIYHFKSRFRPEYCPVYMASSTKITPASIVSMFKLWKLLELRPLRLTRHIWNQAGKSSARQHLASPETGASESTDVHCNLQPQCSRGAPPVYARGREAVESMSAPARRPHWLVPKIWAGMRLRGWIRLLIRNRFAVDLKFVPAAAALTGLTSVTSVLYRIQRLFLGRRIGRIRLSDDPVFLVGHWRSGTTLLHELLACHPGFRTPSTYESLYPNHFLVTARMARWFRFMVPTTRAMDNMAMGLDRPQEDELALCNMGSPSEFASIMFPNRPPQYVEFRDLDQLPPRAVERWREKLLTFYRCLCYRRPGRLLIKSPQHTWRLRELVRIFPKARFIHIVRDPLTVFASSVHYWKTMYESEAFQTPNYDALIDDVLQTYTSMQQALDKASDIVESERFYQIRFEDLIANPELELTRIHHWLDLGDLSPEALRRLGEISDYQPNQYEVPDVLAAEIRRKWKAHFERYGYGHSESQEYTVERPQFTP